MMNIAALTTQLIDGQNLTYDCMREVMQAVMSGQVEDVPMAGFLAALETKGETPEELLAGAEIMRELATAVPVSDSEYLVDPVGTGGTGSKVFNVSTASAIVAACVGVKIAKHGGRAASSQSGSADLLEQAGVNIELTPIHIVECVEQFGIGFMFAPNLHAAMRHVVPVRKALGIRTIFNLLGPLTNPSGAKRQVLGVFDKRWLQPMAEVSKRLGKQSVWVIHSHDGLDEISIATTTDVVSFDDTFTIDPRDYGIQHDNLDAVRVDNAAQSLALIDGAFAGKHGAAYDMITLNSAAIMVVSGLFQSYDDAVTKAREVLDSGQAGDKLAAYAQFTQQL